MAFVSFVKRIQRAHPESLVPCISNSFTQRHIPSSPPFSTLYFTLTRTFHQTRTLPSHTRPDISRLSTLQLYHNHNLYQNQDINDTHVNELVNLLKNADSFPSEGEAITFLDQSGVKPNEGLINSAIWALKDEWKLAFWVFKWGEKWGFNVEKNWSLIIWVLGNHKKFNTAWCLVRDLHRSSMGTKRAMLVMIDRYAAANDPGKAIQTFQIMDKFSMTPDLEAFHTLLNALCKHGNIEEAEEFMLLNKKLFPLESEGFNIILNGWSNISVDVFEAKRVWREMSKCCILPNATSYTHMISCFSKVGNLFDSLRLYDEMKKRGWVPGLEVYNSLIYILTRENCLKAALKILDKMKEMGFQPDSATYNSMICPLCETAKLEEARTILATMIGEKVNPTIETYHAFLQGASLEGTLEVLNRMGKAGPGPSRYTFVLILDKFFKLEQPENALKIWGEMKRYDVVPDSSHYTVLVEGLARCGLLMKAREFYAEMIANGIRDDPKLKKILKGPLRDNSRRRIEGRMRIVRHIKNVVSHGNSSSVKRNCGKLLSKETSSLNLNSERVLEIQKS